MLEEKDRIKLFPNLPNDMKMKRRALLILIAVVIVIWFATLRSRGTIGIPDELIAPQIENQNVVTVLMECKKQTFNRSDPQFPVIYAITPTYTRPVQKAELTRLSHTLMLVPNLHWIVVEDADSHSSLVANLLKRSGLIYTHLIASTPPKWKPKNKGNGDFEKLIAESLESKYCMNKAWTMPRGVQQRNAALEWIRKNLNSTDKGVIYFADDDNTYSLEVFEEMRHTKGVSVWPVGLVGGLMVERPIVNPGTGRVMSFNSAWHPQRPFPIDMAGFAINLNLFLSRPEAKFSFDVERGYQESAILRHLTTREELEPKADNCTKVYVWHTRTEAPKLPEEQNLIKKGLRSDKGFEI